jgi:two-component system, sensor histidine kinase and response regulator
LTANSATCYNLGCVCSNLIVLIDDILDLSKIEADRILLECIDFDLIDLLTSLHFVFKVTTREKLIDFQFTNEPGIASLWVRGDPTRLRQVLSNLLSNALCLPLPVVQSSSPSETHMTP